MRGAGRRAEYRANQAVGHASIPQPRSPNQGQQAHPRRVVAKLDGFDLAPAKRQPRIRLEERRGVREPLKLVLYAPHKAKIYTLRPAFSWKGDPTAKYKLHIQDVTGTFAWDRELTGTSLAYPADAPPLSPGGTYLWKVDPCRLCWDLLHRQP
jgi:hypothetical protein